MKMIEEEYSLAIKLNKQGAEHYTQHRYKQAEKNCLKAVKLGRLLVEYDRDKYERSLAIFLNNLGKIYMGMHRMEDSFLSFKEAWEIIHKMSAEKKNADNYGMVNLSYNDYAMLYSYFAMEIEGWYNKAQESEFEEGCKLFDKAFTYADMIEYNERGLGLMHFLYGQFYHNHQHLDEAEQEFDKALAIYRKCAFLQEAEEKLSIAAILVELGAIKDERKQYAESITMLKEALSIYMDFDVRSPNKYDETIKDLRKNLQSLNIKLKQQGKNE